MKILKATAKTETIIKASRFVAEAFPCDNQSDARKIIKSQKERYSDASHVVHAFVIGKNSEIMGMSDDGEPAGTSGRPALDALKGSGIVNVIVTITRYFGGTLLGTGGLVKAYGGAVKAVLDEAERAGLVEEYTEKAAFQFECGYSIYKGAKNILKGFKIWNLQEDFSETVFARGQISKDEYAALAAALSDFSKGAIKLTSASDN